MGEVFWDFPLSLAGVTNNCMCIKSIAHGLREENEHMQLEATNVPIDGVVVHHFGPE